MSLKNKIVVITGAASPIGATVTRAMVAEGAHVILGDLMGKELAELAAAVGGAPHVVGDLGDEVVAKRLIDTAITAHGRIEVLVNNAGGGIILEKSSRFRRPSPPVFALIRYTNA